VLLNAISAAVWGILMVWAGFMFGKAINLWLHAFKSATLAIVAAGAAVLLIALSPRLLRHWRR
jgi:membrane protein DedA with SNARE-associated domain